MNRFRRFWGLRPWKRHGLILLGAGAIYFCVGITYAFSSTTNNRAISLEVFLRVAPIQVWGGVFAFAGILSIASSRWPPFAETWGYMVLTGISMGWSAAYLMSIIFGTSPWTNISGALVWGLLAFLWWGISGLLNPDMTGVTHGVNSP